MRKPIQPNSAKSLLVIFEFVVVVASPAIEDPTKQEDMSNREASKPAVDWECKSASSLTTVLVSNKVTTSEILDDDIGTISVSEVPPPVEPNQQVFNTTPLPPPGYIYSPHEDVSTVTDPTDHGLLANPAGTNQVPRGDFQASAGRARAAFRTSVEADNEALREQLEAAREEIAVLKARLEARDGTSGGQQDPPTTRKKEKMMTTTTTGT